MRKWILLFLSLGLAVMPAAAGAQELPELFSAAYDSAREGLKSGMELAMAGMDRELTLEIHTQSARIEEGKTIELTIAAGNPRPVDTPVTLELHLPRRLSAAGDTTFQAVLPAAQMNAETGEIVPSMSTFTREISLKPGGGSEKTAVECEMSMGTRFYRSEAQLELCVSDVSAAASVQGTDDGRLYPGDEFAYTIEIANAGTASRDVRVDLLLPEHVTLKGGLPAGFEMKERTISGIVHAKAAEKKGDSLSASSAAICLSAVVDEDALEGDKDALYLLSGALRVDEERVALPRLQVCGPKISAQLLSETDTLKAGEQTQLSMVVVNAGLAPAHVRLSCVLPDGLKLVQSKEKDDEEKARRSTDLQPPDGGRSAAAQNAKKDAKPASTQTDGGMLVYELNMPAGKQTKDGIEASSQVIRLNVAAREPVEEMEDQLVGAALAWSVDEGETQLGEAVAMRLGKPGFLGLAKGDWNALFWASALLVMIVVCLCAAAKSDRREEDFCCE